MKSQCKHQLQQNNNDYQMPYTDAERDILYIRHQQSCCEVWRRVIFHLHRLRPAFNLTVVTRLKVIPVIPRDRIRCCHRCWLDTCFVILRPSVRPRLTGRSSLWPLPIATAPIRCPAPHHRAIICDWNVCVCTPSGLDSSISLSIFRTNRWSRGYFCTRSRRNRGSRSRGSKSWSRKGSRSKGSRSRSKGSRRSKGNMAATWTATAGMQNI